MSVRAVLLAAPRVPLRYLVSFSPRPRGRIAAESCYLPMEAISEFGGIDASRMRPTDELWSGYSYIADGDVAFAKVTPCFENGKGMHAVGLPGGHAFATTEITVMRPRAGLDPRYLAWVLQSEDFRSPGESQMSGAGGLKRVPESYAASFRISNPHVEVQRAIADYLDRETAQIDAFIAKNEELIALLTERRASAIVELIGEHETIPLKRLVSSKRPLTYGILQCGEPIADGVPYIGPADLPGEGASPALSVLRRTTPEIAAAYSRSVLAGGDIVVSIGPAFGRVGLLSDELSGANLTQDTVRVASLAEKVVPEYLVSVLSSRIAHDYWDYQILGATFRRLNLGTLGETPIPLPPLHLQQQIVEELERVVERIDNAVGVAQRSVELARERRIALISAAVTGKIDVGVAA